MQASGDVVSSPGAAPGCAGRSRAFLFFPDLSLAVALVTLFYCLFLYEGTRKLFRDSDSGWHIRAGESMLAAMSLPRTDPYSFSMPGKPWFAWEWASDVASGAAHRLDGLRGVALLYGAAIAACTWLWFRLHWAGGGDFFLACLFAAPMLSTVNLHWLARPHVFGWLFALGALLYAENRRRSLVIVALFAALWANFHASFFLAPVIALIYAAACFLRPLIWDIPRADEWRDARWFAQAAVVAGLASLANPYGWQLHRHVLSYLTDSELLQRIGEFQSFNFHAQGAGQILVAVGLAAAGSVLALSQRRVEHFLLGVLLIAGALRSARGLPLVALLLLPLANGAITSALQRAGGLRPRLRRALDEALAYSARIRQLDVGRTPSSAAGLPAGQSLPPVREAAPPASQFLRPGAEPAPQARPSFQPVTEAAPPASQFLRPVAEASAPASPSFPPVSEAAPPASPSLLPVKEPAPPASQFLRPITEASAPASPSFLPVTEASAPASPSFRPVAEPRLEPLSKGRPGPGNPPPRRLAGLILAPAALAVAFIVLHAPAISSNTGFPPGEFPVAASAAVDRLPPEARLLAPDKYGGYLIYRFQGRRKVFFDGRSDYYGATFMKDYIPLIELRQGWREQIERWGFTHALLPVNYSLVPALRAAGWRELYRDSTAVLLERV